MRHVKAREFQGCDVAYDFSNPSTLYDATTGGSLVAADGAIARAEDLSGNGNHMTQGTGAAQPLRKVAHHNGVDAGLFDGSNDYMTAGDVADVRTNPVEVCCVARRTGGGTSVIGFFGKSRASPTGGRYSLLVESAKDEFIFHKSAGGNTAAAAGTSTQMQVMYGHGDRNTGTNQSLLYFRQNGTQTATNSSPGTDLGTDFDTTDELMLGAYQTSGGVPSFAGSFLTGYIGEAAKWQREFTPAMRRRFEHSRMRKWRISA